MGFEKITPKLVFDLVAGELELKSVLLDGDPSQITTGEMIALRTRFTALTFGAAHQLLEFTVQLLDMPPHSVFVFHVVSGLSRWLAALARVGAIGNEPFNVAV